MDVEKHCPGSIADVGDMDVSSGEVPDQPGVHRSEAQFSRLGLGTCARHVFQDPADFGRAEIGVQDEPGLLAYELRQVLFLETVAILRRPAVLPYDGIVNRLAGLRIPDNRRLALVSDADTGNVQSVDSQCCNGLGHHGCF